MSYAIAERVRLQADIVWAEGFKEAAGHMHEAARLIARETPPTSIQTLISEVEPDEQHGHE